MRRNSGLIDSFDEIQQTIKAGLFGLCLTRIHKSVTKSALVTEHHLNDPEGANML